MRTSSCSRDVEFTQYRTYAWMEQESTPLIRNSPLPDDAPTNEELDAMIRTKVDKHLQKRGLRKVGKGAADLLVTHVGIGRLLLETTKGDSGVGAWPGGSYGHWRPFARGVADSYMRRHGTLTLDLVDANSNELVWRCSSSGVIKPTRKNLEKMVEKGAKKLLKKYPPK